jgi:PPOX class probable F420-dependent enzyme
VSIVRESLTDEQKSMLKGLNFGVVATEGERGRLQTSVVWVDTDGENVLFNTTSSRAKSRHLRDHPEVSITVWDAGDPYRYFEVQGTAALETEGANEHIHELARRYAGRDFRTPVDRVIVRIKPRYIRDYIE